MAYSPYGYPNYSGGFVPQYSAPSYAQPMQPVQYQPQPQTMGQQVPSNQITYVNGDEGAKAYIVAPNSSIMLMDSDSPKFYIKSANQNGQMSLRTFRFEEVLEGATPKSQETEKKIDLSEFAKKDDLKELEQKILAKLDEIKAEYKEEEKHE